MQSDVPRVGTERVGGRAGVGVKVADDHVINAQHVGLMSGPRDGGWRVAVGLTGELYRRPELYRAVRGQVLDPRRLWQHQHHRATL